MRAPDARARTLIAPLAPLATAAVLAPTANATHFCNGRGQVVNLEGQAYITVDVTLGEVDICQDSLTPDIAIF